MCTGEFFLTAVADSVIVFVNVAECRKGNNVAITAEILNDLVDKIVIHAPDKISGHRKQKIEIYYKAVGIINIADEDCVVLDGRLGMQNRKKKKTA